MNKREADTRTVEKKWQLIINSKQKPSCVLCKGIGYVYTSCPNQKNFCEKGNEYIMCNNIPGKLQLLKDIIERSAPITILDKGKHISRNVDDIGYNIYINRV